MFIKTVEYTDYSGVDRTTKLHFNLSKAEIAEMEMNESQMAADGEITGGMEEKLELIKSRGRGNEILKAFKDIVFMSYGVRQNSEEFGEIFDKSATRSRDFERSAAYEVFFLWLIEDPDNAALFINKIMPKDWDKEKSNRPSDKPDPSRRPGQQNPPKAVEPTQVEAPKPANPTPAQPEQGREPTPEELREFFNKHKKSEDS